jgi:hypothetical protein
MKQKQRQAKGSSRHTIIHMPPNKTEVRKKKTRPGGGKNKPSTTQIERSPRKRRNPPSHP